MIIIGDSARLSQVSTVTLRYHDEKENKMSNYDVVIKTVPAMLVASCQVRIPTNDQVPQYLDPAFNETYDYVRKQGAKDTGLCFTLWHSFADEFENEEAEAIVPIDRQIEEMDRIRVYQLPAAQVAAVVHQGDFADFTKGHAALLEWVYVNEYIIVGPYREIYIKHNKANLSDTVTEIQFPVQKGWSITPKTL
jgi:effector-binding domain-containing protein